MATNRFIQESRRCSYLPAEQATIEYEFAWRISPHAYEGQMNAGWRKFGMLLFHPVCERCSACRPVRVIVDRFQPNRSQRRARQRNEDLRVTVGIPAVDSPRLDLLRRYHRSQELRKGWEFEDLDAADYFDRFLNTTVPTAEIAVWDGDDLCAVAVAEITPNTVSAIYHYYDPDRLDRSLGTFAILQVLDLARRLAKPFVYLGYYVAGCGSTMYKANFRPCQILRADGEWYDFPDRPE